MERTMNLHIKNKNDFKYYVIKFLQLPNVDVNEIVCIPWMWIKSIRERDLNVLVLYPIKHPSDIEKHIKDREKPFRDWKSYESVVIYATDSFEDAKSYAAEKMNEINYKYNQCMQNRGPESSASVEKTPHRSKRSADSNQNINQPLKFVVSSNDDGLAFKRSKVFETAEEFNGPYEQSSNSSLGPRITASREFFTELFTLIQDLNTNSARDASMIEMLRKTLIQNAETMRDVAKLTGGYRESQINSSTITPTASTSKGTAVEEKISENNNLNEQDDGDDDDDEVDNNKRSYNPKFVLPPEYDETDSRWTLKHRKPAPELVELMPGSSVYVDADKLNHSLNNANNCRALARMLAVEIFRESALSVCSFTGARASAYEDKCAVVRPGLDENARNVLLKFVQGYGKSKGWKKVETQAIQNCVYIKMHSMRVKSE